MDDNKFDKSIREKLGDYEAPGFDPAALASLHHQMASTAAAPWHATYKTELIVGSTLFICTLLMVGSQWMFTHKATSSLEAEIATLKSKVENSGQLRKEMDALKAAGPDTIRIVEFREKPSSVYLSLLRKIDLLEAGLKTFLDESRKKEGPLLGVSEESAPNLIPATPPLSYHPSANRVMPRTKEKESKRATATGPLLAYESPGKKLSAKTIKAIQKHYQKGIDIKLGPGLLATHGTFSPGDTRYTLSGGLLADFIMSPVLSVETGLLYSQRHNRVTGADIPQTSGFPGADPSLGELKNVDIDSWVIETPFNIRYRYPVTMKSNWIMGGGYSALLYTKQVLEYDYQFGANRSASLNTSMLNKEAKLYPGTVNLFLGYSRELKNKKTIEISLYYQHGLGKIGIEQAAPVLFGIRGAYWFTLK